MASFVRKKVLYSPRPPPIPTKDERRLVHQEEEGEETTGEKRLLLSVPSSFDLHNVNDDQQQEFVPTPQCTASTRRYDISNDGAVDCPELPQIYGPCGKDDTSVKEEDIDYYFNLLYNNVTIGFDYEVHSFVDNDVDSVTDEPIKYVEGVLLEYLAWLWGVGDCNDENNNVRSRALLQPDDGTSGHLVALSSKPQDIWKKEETCKSPVASTISRSSTCRSVEGSVTLYYSAINGQTKEQSLNDQQTLKSNALRQIRSAMNEDHLLSGGSVQKVIFMGQRSNISVFPPDSSSHNSSSNDNSSSEEQGGPVDTLDTVGGSNVPSSNSGDSSNNDNNNIAIYLSALLGVMWAVAAVALVCRAIKRRKSNIKISKTTTDPETSDEESEPDRHQKAATRKSHTTRKAGNFLFRSRSDGSFPTMGEGRDNSILSVTDVEKLATKELPPPALKNAKRKSAAAVAKSSSPSKPKGTLLNGALSLSRTRRLGPVIDDCSNSSSTLSGLNLVDDYSDDSYEEYLQRVAVINFTESARTKSTFTNVHIHEV